MTASEEMVARAWEDVRYPKRWVPVQSRRTWTNGTHEVSDLALHNLIAGDPTYYMEGGEATEDELQHALSMIQLSQSNIITRREAIERMVFE